MDLILWRHAEARDAEPGESDLERPLTPRGQKQAERMASWLEPRLPPNTRVLVSPARRTLATARALGRRGRTLEVLAPGGSAAALLHAAGWPDGDDAVLVVGHQPTLGDVARRLMTGEAGSSGWAVRKGAVWWLHGRERQGRHEVVLLAVVGPDQV